MPRIHASTATQKRQQTNRPRLDFRAAATRRRRLSHWQSKPRGCKISPTEIKHCDSDIRKLSRVAHSDWSGARLLATLIAYLDESGGTDNPIFVLAGYVSTAHRWSRYQREWRQALKEAGVGYFHMKEAAHLRGQFEGWSARKRDALIIRLIHIIKENALLQVNVAVSVPDYNELQPLLVNAPPYSQSAYFFCFQTAISSVMSKLAEQGYQDEVAFIFDENKQRKAGAYYLYSKFKEWGYPFKDRLGPITFADDKKITPLQAADLLAWESLKFAREKAEGTNRNTRKSLVSLLEIDLVSKFWNRDALLKFREGIEERKSNT